MAPPRSSKVEFPSVERPSLDTEKLLEFLVESLKEATFEGEITSHEAEIPSGSWWIPNLDLKEGSRFCLAGDIEKGKFALQSPIWIKGLSIGSLFGRAVDPFSRLTTNGRPQLISDFCTEIYDVGDRLAQSPLGELYPDGKLKPVPLTQLWEVVKEAKETPRLIQEGITQIFREALDKIYFSAKIYGSPIPHGENFCFAPPAGLFMGVNLYLNFPATLELEDDFQKIWEAVGSQTSLEAYHLDLKNLGSFLQGGWRLERALVQEARLNFDSVENPSLFPFLSSRRARLDLTDVDLIMTVPTSEGDLQISIAGDLGVTVDRKGGFNLDLKGVRLALQMEGGRAIRFQAVGLVGGEWDEREGGQMERVFLTLFDLTIDPMELPLPLAETTSIIALKEGALLIDYDRSRPVENLFVKGRGGIGFDLLSPKANLKTEGTVDGSLRLSYREGELYYLPESVAFDWLFDGELQDLKGLPLTMLEEASLRVAGLPFTDLPGADERRLKVDASVGSFNTPFGRYRATLATTLQVLFTDGLGKIGFMPNSFRADGAWKVKGLDRPLDVGSDFLVMNDGEETLWSLNFDRLQEVGPVAFDGSFSLAGSFGVFSPKEIFGNWQVVTHELIDLMVENRMVIQGMDLSGGHSLLAGVDLAANFQSFLGVASGSVTFQQKARKGKEFLQGGFDLRFKPLSLGGFSLHASRARGGGNFPLEFSPYWELFQGEGKLRIPVWGGLSGWFGGKDLSGNVALKPRGSITLDPAKNNFSLRLFPAAEQAEVHLKVGPKEKRQEFKVVAALQGGVSLATGEEETVLKVRQFGITDGTAFLLEGGEETPLVSQLAFFLENPRGWPLNELPQKRGSLLDLRPGRVKMDGEVNLRHIQKIFPPERPVVVEGRETLPIWVVSPHLPLGRGGVTEFLRQVLRGQMREDRRQEKRERREKRGGTDGVSHR